MKPLRIKAFQELHKTAINQEQGTECLAPKRGAGGSNPLGDAEYKRELLAGKAE